MATPFSRLPVAPPVQPMLAKNAAKLPEGSGWRYEPKWDGYRCIVFRDGDDVEMWSRGQKSLVRYFPELIDPLREQLPDRVVVDGELVVIGTTGLDFDLLGNRIHPADSRVQMLAVETPARFLAFDLLALGDENLMAAPFADRRARLEEILGDARPPVHLTPITASPDVARDWFHRFEGAGLDGVIAKPAGDAYTEGKRAQIKLKHQRTADVVIAGYRLHKSGDGVGSLLLGLHDDAGELQSIGVASSFSVKRRGQLVDELAPHEIDDLTTHPWAAWALAEAHEEQRMPGAPSRWSSGKGPSRWYPLDCELVGEVTFNQLTSGRLRHPAKLLRWRPDKPAAACGYDQLAVILPSEFSDLFG